MSIHSINQEFEDMINKSLSPMDRLMAVILDFYPVIRRMQYNLYARGLQELDIDIANHHATIMKMLQESGQNQRQRA